MAADDRDLNRDPITDEPGAHPVGTGVGATGGAVAGAAAGTIAGPIGTVVGGVIGAVVGGLAGKAAAEAINPTAEEAHWRENYNREPYYEQGRSYDDYAPAYRHGLQGRLQHDGDWEQAEPHLAGSWDSARSGSSLGWEQARHASRAAWDRAERQGGGSHAMGSDTAVVRAQDLAGGRMGSGGTDMANAGIGTRGEGSDAAMRDASTGRGTGTATGTATGAAGTVGALQSAGNDSGSRSDVVDVLQDLVETCKDGEHGFRESAEQAKRQDLKSLFLQRADACRRGAEELNDQIRHLGGTVETSGSALGTVHRGWVAVKATLTTYDDHAVLEECERGEDNALARYRKALKSPLPENIRQLVERQLQGVQRNHDEIKRLRDQARQDDQRGGTAAAGSSPHAVSGQPTHGAMGLTGSTMGPGGPAERRAGTQTSGVAHGAGTATGVAGTVGAMQSAGDDSGSRSDVVDVLQDLVEVCKDGEYGFRQSAERAQRQDLQSLFTQRAQDCQRGAQELNAHIRRYGGTPEDSGSALGAVHRGWVSVKSALSTNDDKAILEECERGEDNALARYRKALQKPLPAECKALVERQLQGVQRNHDQIKMLRDSTARG
jgi:uncharacterized protein (TIGR02284 family)